MFPQKLIFLFITLDDARCALPYAVSIRPCCRLSTADCRSWAMALIGATWSTARLSNLAPGKDDVWPAPLVLDGAVSTWSSDVRRHVSHTYCCEGQ